MGLRQSVAPTQDVVTLAEAKAHLRVPFTDDDVYIEGLIESAVRIGQHVNGRQFAQATFVWTFGGFPIQDTMPLRLPRSPVDSVTSIQYVDTAGQTQTWDASKWQTDRDAEPALILPVDGVSWPVTRSNTLQAVTITFVAGYSPSNMPSEIKQGIKFLVAQWYDNRTPISTAGNVNKIPDTADKAFKADRFKLFDW